MATAPDPVPESTPAPAVAPPPRDWLVAIANHQRVIGVLFQAVAAFLLILAIWSGRRAYVLDPTFKPIPNGPAAAESTVHGDYLALCVWASLTAIACFAAGVFQLAYVYPPRTERDTSRLFVMSVGGVIGLVTSFILGLGLAWSWWDTFAGGWTAWQGKQGGRIWLVLAAFFGGLF